MVLAEQYVAVPVLLAAWLVLRARRHPRPSFWVLVAASALVAVGTLMRWGAVFWYLPLLLVLRHRSLAETVRRASGLCSVPLVGLLVLFGFFPEAARTARLVDHLVLFLAHFRSTIDTRLLRWREIFGSLLLLIPLLGLLGGGEDRRRRVGSLALAVVLGLLFLRPWIAGGWSEAVSWQAEVGVFGALAVWIAALWLPRGTASARATGEALAFLLPPVIAYAIFWRVNAKYLGEFLPGVLLLAGLGFERIVAAIVERRALPAAMVAGGALGLLWTTSLTVATVAPYAGNISADALRQAAAVVRERVPAGQPVIAGAVLVPLLADRPLAGMLAHPAAEDPLWGGRPNPRFEKTVGPIADLAERGEAGAIVTDKLFFDSIGRHPRLKGALDSVYAPVTEIPSGSGQPLTVYLPKAQAAD